MELSKSTRITLIVVAGVVVLGLAGLAVVSGTELDAGDLFEKIFAGLAGLATGLGLAGGRAS